MLTLKFFRDIPDSPQTFEEIVAASSYVKQLTANGVVSIIMRVSGEEVSQERMIGEVARCEGEFRYDRCYVENMSGKTIDRITPLTIDIDSSI